MQARQCSEASTETLFFKINLEENSVDLEKAKNTCYGEVLHPRKGKNMPHISDI